MTQKMNQLLKTISKTRSVFDKNGSQNLTKHIRNLSLWYFNNSTPVFSCHHIGCLNTKQEFWQNDRILFNSAVRRYTKNSNKGTDPQTIIASKMPSHRKNGKTKIREAIEERQWRFRKDVKHALDKRRVSLMTTRRKIQERGKLLMQDIKDKKEKVKEKIEEVIERENVYTIPNLLCITRIGLSPFLSYLIVSQHFEYALAFMIVAGISDWTDGWIARNYKNQSSKIGSFLDPMADKVLIGTLFLSLTYIDLIPVPLTGLIIGRDVILIISGFIIRYQSLPPPRTLSRYFDVTHATAQLAPTLISKFNTGVQMLLAATTLAAPVFGYVNHQFLQILWYITATSTVAAAISYIFSKETYKYLKNQKKIS